MTHENDMKRQWDGLESDKRVATILTSFERAKEIRKERLLDLAVGVVTVALFAFIYWRVR